MINRFSKLGDIIIRVFDCDRKIKYFQASAPVLDSVVDKHLADKVSRMRRGYIDNLALLGLKFRTCKPSRDVARERAT
jgi:hypothetical protein